MSEYGRAEKFVKWAMSARTRSALGGIDGSTALRLVNKSMDRVMKLGSLAISVDDRQTAISAIMGVESVILAGIDSGHTALDFVTRSDAPLEHIYRDEEIDDEMLAALEEEPEPERRSRYNDLAPFEWRDAMPKLCDLWLSGEHDVEDLRDLTTVLDQQHRQHMGAVPYLSWMG